MKKFYSFLALSSLLTFSSQPIHAQQEFDEGSIVITGAIVASLSAVVMEFSGLTSGNVIWIGPEGVQIRTAAESVGSDVPRLSASGISALPPMEKEALKRRIQESIDDLFAAMNDPDSGVTEDDVSEIMQFLLGLDLPWDERFLELVDQNLGVGFVAQAEFASRDLPVESRETDPSFLGSTDDEIEDPVQVTDPIDRTPYFAP